MPAKRLFEYFRAIRIIEAQQKLIDLDVASFAYWKKEHRKKERDRLGRIVRRGIDRGEAKPITVEELLQGRK